MAWLYRGRGAFSVVLALNLVMISQEIATGTGLNAMARKGLIKSVAYLRTSSAANTGADKDSGKRQQAAIEVFARAAGYEVEDSYYDEAVSGADHITARPGFAAMMEHIASNGVRTIVVETANRFARDLIVQETGY